MTRQLKKSQYMFLSKELEYCQNKDLITDEQKGLILKEYSLKQGLNFLKIVVTLGAILVGLGILSFIAGNWDGINKIVKVAIILFSYTGVNVISYRVSADYPKTGRSLIYLGGLIYGAGIFLIGQIFNFGGDFHTAFLLWSMGIVPVSLQQKDKYFMLFAYMLFLVYITGSIENKFPWGVLLGIPAAYLIENYFNQSKLLLFCANLIVLDTIFAITMRFELDGLYIAIIFLALGLLMYFIKHSLDRDIFRLQGNILFGITGIALTMPQIWRTLINSHTNQMTVTILFAIAYVILLFALIKKGSMVSLVFVCLTIFRYYTDTLSLMPKSLFFIVGGLILLGFGYYFERMRKSHGGIQV